ncbi:MAG: hypothetical protein NTX03_06065 [Bacteroidetes bacterium]|nr:hypothetical protein [Bacteroidota bacterium]
MDNKITKYGNRELEKIGNQITITNKLLDNGFDYLRWYYSLDECWRNPIYLIIKILLKADEGETILRNPAIKRDDTLVYTFEKEFEANNQASKRELIKISLEFKSIHIGYSSKRSILVNLSLLIMFPNVEELVIFNCEILTLYIKPGTKGIKKLIMNKSKINPIELDKFSKANPNCEITILKSE